MGLRHLLSSLALGAMLVGVSGCRGAVEPHSASDKASGLTVSVAGDQVTLQRSPSSRSGTAGTAGQVSCTTDYSKLVNTKTQPSPDAPWYATTLIKWPDKAQSTSATLSHSLAKTPVLCIAHSDDEKVSVVVYFEDDVKSTIEKQQINKERDRQAGAVDQALSGAAQAAVGALAGGKIPDVPTLTQVLTSQGFYVRSAETAAAATERGTMYIVKGDTTAKQVVLSLKGTDGKVRTATQKIKGDPVLK